MEGDDWRLRVYVTLCLASSIALSSPWVSSLWRRAWAREGEAISQEPLKCRGCTGAMELSQRKQDRLCTICGSMNEGSTNPSPIRVRSLPAQNVFCPACAKNQETVVRLLSCYDPPNSVCSSLHDQTILTLMHSTRLAINSPCICKWCTTTKPNWKSGIHSPVRPVTSEWSRTLPRSVNSYCQAYKKRPSGGQG